MAVAHDASSESHTGTAGDTASGAHAFTWTHTPVGTPAGVLVFLMTNTPAANYESADVTYGGIPVPEVEGTFAVDTSGELGYTRAFFLGGGIPTGPQTVSVGVAGATGYERYAVAITVTAGASTGVYLPGIVLLNEDQALAEQSVDDGSPGTNSMRYAAVMSGRLSVPSPGANSTALESIDYGSRVAATVRETTAGQGSRSVGFTATSDDVAAYHLAVREVYSPPFVPPSRMNQRQLLAMGY